MIEQQRLVSNPFPGLRPFETDENYLFFGRDGQSDDVLTKLRTARFVAVVGTSGSGKSSLVRAGLLPALFSGHMPSAGSSWRVATFRPGNSPISNLAKALSEPGVFGADEKDRGVRLTNIERTLRHSSLGLLEVVAQSRMAPYENLLVLADQFEELFRFRNKSTSEHPEDEASALVKLLLEAKQSIIPHDEKLPIYVILTMRSDYLGDCAHFRGLPEAINEGQFLIPRMTDDNRREAITGPVIVGGGSITAPLVNRLLNDAGDDPAQLPILQHALMRTWDYWKRKGRINEPIDIPDYEAIGGMSRALSNHADEAYLELPPGLQKVCEKLFKCLTEKEADNREVRRPATVREIAEATEASDDQVETVIESFRFEGRSFLMPPPTVPLTSYTLIDISHESLIKGWPRLREWVDQEARAARQYVRLADAAALFPDQQGFLRDPELHVNVRWREDNKPTRAWADRYHPGFEKAIAYLDESQANRDAEIAAKEREQREKYEENLRHAEAIAAEQRRRLKLQRWGMALLSLLLIAMFGVTVFALALRSRVANALKEVEVERDNAKRAEAKAEQQRQIAVNALQSVKQERDKAQKAEGIAATERDTAQRERKRAEEQTAIAQKAKNEAEHQKGIAEENLVRANSAAAKALLAQENAVNASKEAEAQKTKAEEALKTVQEIDRSAPYFKAIMRGHKNPVVKARFINNGTQVFSQSEEPSGIDGLDVNSLIWNPSTGQTESFLPSDRVRTVVVGVSESGKVAIFEGVDNGQPFTAFWDVEAKKQLVQLPWKSFEAPLVSLISPDGRTFLHINLAKEDEVEVVDTQTGRQRALLDAQAVKNSDGGSFTPDSKRFVVTKGASAYVLDLNDGRVVLKLLGHVDNIEQVAFSSDSKLTATASRDGTARLWDLTSGAALATLGGHDGDVTSTAFSDDGKYIVTTSKNRAYLWEAKSPGNWSQVSDDSPTILEGHTDKLVNAIFSHDGKWVVTISEDRTAQLWDARVLPALHAAGGTRPAIASSIAVFRGHIKPLTSVSFSPDSKYVVTASDDKTARVWDLTSLGAFTIASIDLNSDPSTYDGRCPVTIKFKGTISVAGRSGKVKYKFVRSDGTETLPEELVFDGPGLKEVSTTREVFYSGVNRAGKPLSTDGWVKLQILEPFAMESKEASFTVKCAETDIIGGASVIFTDLTPAQVLQIVPEADEQQIANYLRYLRRAMQEFGINTPLRQAAFLAEVVYGTAGFRVLEEKGTDEYLEKQYGYRKDLGNFQQGDGARYKGRGAFMLTGKSNYQAFGSLLGVDLVTYPEKAASPEFAFRTAALYWQRNGLNEIADKDDIVNVSRRIGGSTGLDQIRVFYDRAKKALRASEN
jgi:WD40 repeat protein/predicted chitinase